MTTFDVICIGGGSGGIAAGAQAAKLGQRVAVIEQNDLGGACVNRGCVPKKAMWHAADLLEKLHHDAPGYGINCQDIQFDWATLKQSIDQYINNIHNAYQRRFEGLNITHYAQHARLTDAHTVQLDDGTTLTGQHIFLAPGGSPSRPTNIPGAEHGITSDEFFELETQPQKAVVVGAGYIGVEIAGVFNGLGTETHLLIRKDQPLRGFDQSIRQGLMEASAQLGLSIHTHTEITQVDKAQDGTLNLKLNTGETITDVDCLLWAIGRHANTETLGLEQAGVATQSDGKIQIDQWQQTSQAHIYALGDATDAPELTPVAIAAGRRLARRLFNGESELKLDTTYVPTVVFSHPPIGTVGMSQEQAIEHFGQDDVTIHQARFSALYSAVPGTRLPTIMKLVTVGQRQTVVGCHMLGHFVDEILQGVAVAVQMGASKADFDNTIAIHPTSGEELVTM